MTKYKVGKDWLTLKQWKDLILAEYDEIMKYQELSTVGTDENGNDRTVWIEIKLGIDNV